MEDGLGGRHAVAQGNWPGPLGASAAAGGPHVSRGGSHPSHEDVGRFAPGRGLHDGAMLGGSFVDVAQRQQLNNCMPDGSVSAGRTHAHAPTHQQSSSFSRSGMMAQGSPNASAPKVAGGRSLRPRGAAREGARHGAPVSSADEASNDGGSGEETNYHSQRGDSDASSDELLDEWAAGQEGSSKGRVTARGGGSVGRGDKQTPPKGRMRQQPGHRQQSLSGGGRPQDGDKHQQRHRAGASAPPGWAGGALTGARVASTARGAADAAAAGRAAELFDTLPSHGQQQQQHGGERPSWMADSMTAGLGGEDLLGNTRASGGSPRGAGEGGTGKNLGVIGDRFLVRSEAITMAQDRAHHQQQQLHRQRQQELQQQQQQREELLALEAGTVVPGGLSEGGSGMASMFGGQQQSYTIQLQQQQQQLRWRMQVCIMTPGVRKGRADTLTERQFCVFLCSRRFRHVFWAGWNGRG